MQNKLIIRHEPNNPVFKACLLLLLLLFIRPGFAQQSGTEQQTDNATAATTPATEGNDGTPPNLSKSSPNKANNTKAKRAPSTQFTPTEKIRADDAVAFPVDI